MHKLGRDSQPGTTLRVLTKPWRAANGELSAAYGPDSYSDIE